MYIQRYNQTSIALDLREKMVFLAGPRQVGKTTLAKQLLSDDPEGLYLNWDNREDRFRLRSAAWPGESCLVVLDELHKYPKWKNWLKGEYDKHGDRIRFLVTGSAHLEVYRKGGDSLQGRYHHHRLHPFSLAELELSERDSLPQPGDALSFPTLRASFSSTLTQLLSTSCFPEPFLSTSERSRRRWRKERLDRFLMQDVRDLNMVRDIGLIQLLADLLPERVGSLLSVNSLAEDLEVSHKAVSHWLDILEQLFFLFRVSPFDTRLARSLKRKPKLYLWEHGLIPKDGARLENLVGCHLLKFCHLLEDREGHRISLHFLRDKDGHEVDFLITHDRKPWIAVEVKRSGQTISPSLRYYVERLEIPYAIQVVLEGDHDFVTDNIRCMSAAKFLSALV
ncbi:MAG: ATP-binding protein [Proteobacteria bacterium]|nr:ATP-binding protein [Pseudomonadota bacterium]